MTDVPIDIKRGKHGLYYGTSRAAKGLLVIGDSVEEVMKQVPQALAELAAAASETQSNREVEMSSPRTIKVTIRKGDNLWFAESEDWPGCHLAFPKKETLLVELLAAAEYAFEGDDSVLLVQIPTQPD